MAKKCRICMVEGCDPSEHKLIRFIAERPKKVLVVEDDGATN